MSVRWNGLAPKGVRVKAAGRLVLAEQPWRGPGFPEAATASLLERLQREGVGILPWDDRTRGLLARIRFLAAHAGSAHGGSARGTAGPAMLDDAELVRRAPEWLVPRLDFSGGPVLDGAGLLRALSALVPGRRADLDRLVPGTLVLPTGTRCPIDYSSGVPVVEARIQEVFGMRRAR